MSGNCMAWQRARLVAGRAACPHSRESEAGGEGWAERQCLDPEEFRWLGFRPPSRKMAPSLPPTNPTQQWLLQDLFQAVTGREV